MSLSTSITEELLFSYFNGRATLLQKQWVEKWKEDPANEEIFYATLHKWENEHLQYQVDVNKAIEKFNVGLSANRPSAGRSSVGQKEKDADSSKWKPWLIAASLLIILGVNSYLFRDTIFYKAYSTSFGKTGLINLADGSKVVLNANSSLKIPRFGFFNNARKVYLKGEACFSVVHTPDNSRFVVQTDSMFNIEVLGTEFSVFTRPRQTKIMLLKGKIKVHYSPEKKQASVLTLSPGDLLTYSKKQEKPHIMKVGNPESSVAWMQNRFVFNDTSLSEILNIINENYGLTVELRGKDLIDKTLSGSFKAKSGDEFLESISQVLDLNMIRQNDHVILFNN
ncbi:MAG: iron dicitrate transport regulator FecR [Cytophagales bacterium CG18_big_fil_WC_8_21_14_2_50_42_9]|nr:MAG: iron dicitrate transport regulator FecR [Cytophagales bacterium CG18_big_fil_WC_8_21_14_2_50_42_9]